MGLFVNAQASTSLTEQTYLAYLIKHEKPNGALRTNVTLCFIRRYIVVKSFHFKVITVKDLIKGK